MQELLHWQAIMDHLDIIKDQHGAKESMSYLARIRANDLKVSMKTQLVSVEDLIEMKQYQTFQKMVREILVHYSRNNP
ncbi:hypothetical protein YC2023_059163 [Brassica napus]